MGCRVAAAVSASGYSNAGTVEFLRDPSGSLYFMEINARLQVEHPVTEMVTGVDLVQQQLRVAANEPLTFGQDAVKIEGHAIEFRINAERVEHDFAPDPGEITRFVAPSDSADVRWDSAVEEGYRIPPWYDSMIGKLIIRGSDRADAIARARDVLNSMILEGVETTIPLHRRLLEDEQFVSGDYNLNRLEQVLA
jgi:acetyl-CoA carboxylase biotin carboxylase subunit